MPFEVTADFARARDIGITGVPTIVVDDTSVLSGVESTDTLVERIHRARTVG